MPSLSRLPLRPAARTFQEVSSLQPAGRQAVRGSAGRDTRGWLALLAGAPRAPPPRVGRQAGCAPGTTHLCMLPLVPTGGRRCRHGRQLTHAARRPAADLEHEAPDDAVEGAVLVAGRLQVPPARPGCGRHAGGARGCIEPSARLHGYHCIPAQLGPLVDAALSPVMPSRSACTWPFPARRPRAAPELPRAHLPEVLRRLGADVCKELHLDAPSGHPADRHVCEGARETCGRVRYVVVTALYNFRGTTLAHRGRERAHGQQGGGCPALPWHAAVAVPHQRRRPGCWGSVAAGAIAPGLPCCLCRRCLLTRAELLSTAACRRAAAQAAVAAIAVSRSEETPIVVSLADRTASRPVSDERCSAGEQESAHLLVPSCALLVKVCEINGDEYDSQHG